MTAENLHLLASLCKWVSKPQNGKRTYAAVAVKISTLELEDESSTNPAAKIAVKSVIRPRIKPIEWTLERTVIATVGRRQATTVVMRDVICRIQLPEYSVMQLTMLLSEDLLVVLVALVLRVASETLVAVCAKVALEATEALFSSSMWTFIGDNFRQIKFQSKIRHFHGGKMRWKNGRR
jgi:hypothetical protein